jgi:MSHA biogenesis protein MshE
MRGKPVPGRTAHPDQSETLHVLDALDHLAAPQRDGDAAVRSDGGPRHSGRLLGNLLVLRGYVVADELQCLLEYQASSGKRLGEIAVQAGLISEQVLAELLAEQLRLPVIDLARTPIDRAVACAIPYWEARQMRALPTRRQRDGCIEVAIADPTNGAVLERLHQLLRSSLRLGVAPASKIVSKLDDIWRAPPELG